MPPRLSRDGWKVVGFLVLFALGLLILGPWMRDYAATMPRGL
jgi:hypothetical protein